MLGALPLAFGTGTGSELRRPLGITIIGGLLVSQLLTLYTTPVVYLFFDRLQHWWRRPANPFRGSGRSRSRGDPCMTVHVHDDCGLRDQTEPVPLALAGTVKADSLPEIGRLIESGERNRLPVALDLSEVTLLDRVAARFFADQWSEAWSCEIVPLI